MSAAAGTFDPTVAGSSAWFDADSFLSNFPGVAAGWFDGDYLDPPVETAFAVVVVAELMPTTLVAACVASPNSPPLPVSQ